MTELTEEQIEALLTTRRRAARLRSLLRVAAATGATAQALLPGPTVSFNLPLPLEEGSGAGEQESRGGREMARRGAEAPARRIACRSAAVVPFSSSGALRGLAVPRLGPLRQPSTASVLKKLAAAVRAFPWGLWRDRALLVVEVAALIALIALVAGSFSSLDTLNEEMAEARRVQPVATLSVEEDLPGSSFPPSLNNDMPAPLRALVRSGTPVPIPTPGPQAATRIVIPTIEVDSVTIEGDTWEDLKKGVGHHPGTANPGERGNAVFSGHNDVFGEVFKRLEELKSGDVITMYAGIHLYRYEVKRTRIVGPKEISVMAPTPDATLTLITCYPYRVDTQRFVAVAKLME